MFQDSRVRIYSLQGGTLTEQSTVNMQGEVSVLAYSPDGAYLAVGADRRVSALSATDYKVLNMYFLLSCNFFFFFEHQMYQAMWIMKI